MGGVHLHVRTCAPFFYKCSACRYSVMVGPIALKFGPTLGEPLVTAYAVVTGGVSLHVHTALLYLRNGSADWVQFWYMSWGS